MFELFIARRYLRAKRKQVVISVITAISVVGVAAGVMALVNGVALGGEFREKGIQRCRGSWLIVEFLAQWRIRYRADVCDCGAITCKC